MPRTVAVTATRTLRVGDRHCDRFLQRSSLVRASSAPVRMRWFSGSRAQLHGGNGPTSATSVPKHVGARDDDDAREQLDHDHDHEHDHEDHDHDQDGLDDDDEDDMEDVVDIGPMGKEYGGPQRGGKFKEPTRFGDWERKGRCTDF